MSLLLLIANTIQTTDKSYFFEDYTKQALAVLQRLKEEGYSVVPRVPTESMLQAGEQAILPGKVKPQELAEGIYRAMIVCGERERPAQPPKD